MRAFAAIFEAVDRGLLLEFFDRRDGRWEASSSVARFFLLGGRFDFALDHRQLFGGAHEFGVAVGFARLAEALEALTMPM